MATMHFLLTPPHAPAGPDHPYEHRHLPKLQTPAQQQHQHQHQPYLATRSSGAAPTRGGGKDDASAHVPHYGAVALPLSSAMLTAAPPSSKQQAPSMDMQELLQLSPLGAQELQHQKQQEQRWRPSGDSAHDGRGSWQGKDTAPDAEIAAAPAAVALATASASTSLTGTPTGAFLTPSSSTLSSGGAAAAARGATGVTTITGWERPSLPLPLPPPREAGEEGAARPQRSRRRRTRSALPLCPPSPFAASTVQTQVVPPEPVRAEHLLALQAAAQQQQGDANESSSSNTARPPHGGSDDHSGRHDGYHPVPGHSSSALVCSPATATATPAGTATATGTFTSAISNSTWVHSRAGNGAMAAAGTGATSASDAASARRAQNNGGSVAREGEGQLGYTSHVQIRLRQQLEAAKRAELLNGLFGQLPPQAQAAPPPPPQQRERFFQGLAPRPMGMSGGKAGRGNAQGAGAKAGSSAGRANPNLPWLDSGELLNVEHSARGSGTIIQSRGHHGGDGDAEAEGRAGWLLRLLLCGGRS